MSRDLKLVGNAEPLKEATVEIEISMFGLPTTMNMDIQDIGTFQKVLDALELQGYIDGIHTNSGRHMRAYKYHGMVVLKRAATSSIVAATHIPGQQH